jgi:hypothetical protein
MTWKFGARRRVVSVNRATIQNLSAKIVWTVDSWLHKERAPNLNISWPKIAASLATNARKLEQRFVRAPGMIAQKHLMRVFVRSVSNCNIGMKELGGLFAVFLTKLFVSEVQYLARKLLCRQALLALLIWATNWSVLHVNTNNFSKWILSFNHSEINSFDKFIQTPVSLSGTPFSELKNPTSGFYNLIETVKIQVLHSGRTELLGICRVDRHFIGFRFGFVVYRTTVLSSKRLLFSFFVKNNLTNHDNNYNNFFLWLISKYYSRNWHFKIFPYLVRGENSIDKLLYLKYK